MVCGHCGSRLKENTNFCTLCGRVVNVAPPQASHRKSSRLSRVLVLGGIWVVGFFGLLILLGVIAVATDGGSTHQTELPWSQ